MENKKKNRISRREFIRNTGLVVGGAAALGSAGILASCKATPVTETSTVTVTKQSPTITVTPTTPAMTWDYTADVVIIGAGAVGLPAAIRAKDLGASVLVVEANYDIGGHVILSGGNVPLGAGNSAQQKAGITDSPDLLFADLTDWSVVEPNGMPDYRYNDKEVIRAFADNNVVTYDFLLANGIVFTSGPDNSGATAAGNSAPRENHTSWTKGAGPEGINGANGCGYARPLEASARQKGVQFLMSYHMDTIVREKTLPPSGRVIGITATYKPTILPGTTTPLVNFNTANNINTTKASLNIKANKAVIVASGGSTGNVNFRRIFDPRISEEYCGLSGMPYSDQDASGELAAMTIGASLWGTFNQTAEFGSTMTKAGSIGCQYGYTNLAWSPSNPIFPLCRASGVRVSDYQDIILVNTAGQRFYDETKGQYTSNNYNAIANYVQDSWLNAANITWNPANFIAAAMAGIKGSAYPGGGPIWAIFDADAVTREKWTLSDQTVDTAGGFFYQANTLTDLAAAINKNKYQITPMTAAALQATVTRYNSFVDAGKDADFAKAAPKNKIQTAPFYAAWATPVPHDTRCGLHINGKCQVIDLSGKVIAGLYCGGESAGGFGEHGLARCAVQGYLAGSNAVNIG